MQAGADGDVERLVEDAAQLGGRKGLVAEAQRADALGVVAVYFATGSEGGAVSDVSRAVQPMKFPGNARAAVEAQGTFTYNAGLSGIPGVAVVVSRLNGVSRR